MFQPVAPNLDPADFVVAPHVAALDEFKMTNDDGSFVANVTRPFLEKFVNRMNERERLTGDLSPLVIGHTEDGIPETAQPPVVGFARNWTLGTLGNTGRACAFFDAWVYKDKVELARQFPRRSCEVWASRYEADPISLLGATTPARDLGLMRLSREGSFTFYSPEDTTMPEEKKKDEPKAEPKESGEAKGKDGKQDQILAMLTQLLELMTGGAKPGEGAPVPTEPGAAGGEGSDADYDKFIEQLLQGGGGEPGAQEPKPTESRKSEPEPVKNDATADKYSRLEQEVASTRAELARVQIKGDLGDLPQAADGALVEDLVAMPPDMRKRTIDTIKQLSRTPASFHLDKAVDGAVVARGKRIPNQDEYQRIVKLARDKKIRFEDAATAEGYDLS